MNNQEQNSSDTKDNTDTSVNEHYMQTKEEFTLNKKSDNPKENNVVTSSNEDMQSDDELPVVSDRAAKVEQKTYGDTELNKGLEAQAKNDES